MKITIVVAGTRGDVQPFSALALGLVKRGHQVCFAAPQGFSTFVAHSGAEHFPLTVDYEHIFGSEEGRRWLNSGNLVKFMGMLAEFDGRVRPNLHREMLASCENAEAIISNLLLENSVACIAEKLRRPLMLGYTLPMRPTGDFPSLLCSTLRQPLRGVNKLTHAAMEALYWRSQKSVTNAWRATLGLAPATVSPRHQQWQRGAPTLHAYSRHVVAHPREWGMENFLSGFWVLPKEIREIAGGTPSPELIRFLEAGPPPIYLGYWRLPVLDIAGMLRLATDVSTALGVRFVIGATWTPEELAGLSVPKNIFITGSVDHGWLFERCSATVHHGGAGTTAATMRAGLPMVVCPIYADQPFWARRTEALGVGISVPFRTLNATRLIQALQKLQDPAMRTRAAELGTTLQKEDGVANAVRFVEERLPTTPILGS